MTSNHESTGPRSARPTNIASPSLLAAFVVLWITWAVLLAAALVLANPGWGRRLGLPGLEIVDGHRSIAATSARMGSSLVLVVVGWLACAWWRTIAAGRFAWCIALGMTLGAIGDFFNAGLLNFVPLPDPVLGGIIAFGLGHVAYITGCVDLAKRAGLTSRAALVGAVAAWQLIGLVGWCFVAVQGTEARGLVWPALPYSLLLAGTAGITSGLAIQDRRFTALALGGALFLASDLILACELFRGHFAYDTECVWLTYGPGQMLIVFSTITASVVVRRPALP